jgi:hypothetical protein
MSKKQYTPNDQRAIVKNPTSKEFVADTINTASQLTVKTPPPPVPQKPQVKKG